MTKIKNEVADAQEIQETQGTQTVETIDLSSMDTVTRANEGVWMDVLHPTRLTALPGTAIRLAGVDSDVYQKAQRDVQQARLDNAIAKRTPRSAADVDGIAQDAMEILIRCTLGWRGLVFEGEKLACNRANVRKVYTALPWLREQVDRFISNRSHYFRQADR